MLLGWKHIHLSQNQCRKVKLTVHVVKLTMPQAKSIADKQDGEQEKRFWKKMQSTKQQKFPVTEECERRVNSKKAMRTKNNLQIKLRPTADCKILAENKIG